MMGSNNGFTISYKYVRKAQVYNNITIGSKTRNHNLFAKRVFYNNLYNIRTDALFPVLILVIYNIHTEGNWVAGSPLFLSLQFFLFYHNSFCQQRELPLFLVAVAGKFFSFLLLSFGEGMVTGVTFIFCHLGGFF